jgi:hypothetical protein
MVLNDKVYNVLKWLVQIVLPAAGTLYFALAGYWDLPKPEEVVGTIVAVTAFLGAILGISAQGYKKSDARFDGELTVLSADVDESGQEVLNLAFNADPSVLKDRNEVSFRVNHPAA